MRQIMRRRVGEPTWQDKIDREIEDAEARLQYRIYEDDRALEVLTGQGAGSPNAVNRAGGPVTRY
jgi:hypothetical protein